MADYYWKLKVQQGGRKYDPSQPRVPAGSPEGGRWTAGGSSQGILEGTNLDRKSLALQGGRSVNIDGIEHVVLFHGTSSNRLESILKEGLKPRSTSGVGHEETNEPGGIYMTGYEPAATGFAETMRSRAGGERAVVSILVPKSDVQGTPEWPGGVQKYYEVLTMKSIPPSNIIGAFRVRKGTPGWDLATDYEDLLDAR